MKTIGFLLSILFIFTFSEAVLAQTSENQQENKYIETPTGYLMVLRQGDNLFYELEKMGNQEKIPSANITGIGFVDINFGFFNFETKEYDPKEFKEVELTSMTGSIAWKNKEVSLHLHGVVGDKSFQAYAGHILDATVSTGSVEIFVVVHDKALERKKEQPLGADVLNLGSKN